jgi:predicted RND superfamily exporter protein
MIIKYRKHILVVFGVLTLLSLFFVTKLKFTFDFEQFFPQGDEDLEFFRDFTAEFETDDNFLLIALPREEGVFDTSFLQKFHEVSLAFNDVEYITSVQSLTTMRYPIKTPFGYSTVPIIHTNEANKLDKDKVKVLSDPRFVHNLINQDATALTVLIKTKDRLSVIESNELMASIRLTLDEYNVSDYHILGRAFFQESLINIQRDEILVSSFFSVLFVSLVLFLIFRRFPGVIIALISITVSLLLFMGLMGAIGRPLSIMSALYPVLMLIVGTSDVIHLMSKYIDELNNGKPKETAIQASIKEIGLATFLTSITTAIGFATLLTSRLQPVRDFGINSAIGVIIAFFATMLIATSLLSYLRKDQITKLDRNPTGGWNGILKKIYLFTKKRPGRILVVSSILIAACLFGLTKVTTNYRVEGNLPIGHKVTNDFLFFENEFSGFRPLEFAISVKEPYKADDFEVVREIDKIEQKLLETEVINSILSQATLYKSIARMNAGNTNKAYEFPKTKSEYLQAKKTIDRLNKAESTILINTKNDKTRISSKISDIGADKVKHIGKELDQWILDNIDTSMMSVKRTGTGLIIDKNSVYVTESLIYGLGLALLIISILMALLVKSWKMLILAFIPNIIPVIFAGSLLGYFNIELEASISIVFAVIFGIAVDDTIHFLSKFKLCRAKNLSVERSIELTFLETGKAIAFTTIVLFFGFMIMLFSSNPPTQTVGVLISVTLISALLCDLLLLPVLMRKWLKD